MLPRVRSQAAACRGPLLPLLPCSGERAITLSLTPSHNLNSRTFSDGLDTAGWSVLLQVNLVNFSSVKRWVGRQGREPALAYCLLSSCLQPDHCLMLPLACLVPSCPASMRLSAPMSCSSSM